MGNCLGSSDQFVTRFSTSSAASTAKASSSTATTGKFSSFSSSSFEQSSGSSVRSIEDLSFPDGRILDEPNLQIFSLAELKIATKNFKPVAFLGEGGFGKVYRGWFEDRTLNSSKNAVGMVVAVKKLNSDSMQGLEQWQSEVNFLGRLSHPNLVKLLGYCMEDNELLLVYEFMPKGSLENHLFRRGTAFEPLSWNLRLKIAIGAAQGLAFLHSSEKQIIYRDFKASNVLLDANYTAKLSDFGLAKNGPSASNSHITTRIIGTHGYTAPEYVATGHLYVKSDVYGFGVVLLEMLSGQRALDLNRPKGQHNLVDWAKPFLLDKRKVLRLMDPRLEGQYPSEGALQAAQLTLRCIARKPKNRPSMNEVVQILEEIEAKNRRSREAKVALNQHKVRSHGKAPMNP
ncbi:hypothetical protein HPP92_027262 [Vanilla planifolia]|uniref:non-specific serine/threonine protein kinase n=1 Tax=Vanilla planifolia TaxID=51239 RepID=A0A835PBK4_VANPL|nr:hypothetical protein HPP92_027262 [Vanilla planifolia]KAG0476137.1 hypothetical protein HPP92_012978 [Vanilla planifolia]